MNWRFWKKKKPVCPLPKVRWVQSDERFRRRPDYVKWAREVLRSPEGMALQGYLFSDVPQRVFYRGDAITPEQASLEYGRLCGYLECIARLQEAATDAPVPPEDVEIDYSANLEEDVGTTTAK